MVTREIRALGGEGILSPADLDDFSAAEKRVALLMCDGEWHHADEIRLATGRDGKPASEGLRRFRAVRAALVPFGTPSSASGARGETSATA